MPNTLARGIKLLKNVRWVWGVGGEGALTCLWWDSAPASVARQAGRVRPFLNRVSRERITAQGVLTVHDHVEVLVFRRAGEGLAPIQIEALAAVEIDELLGKDGDGGGHMQIDDLLEGEEVDVVGGVDGLRGAEDGVRDREPAPQIGRVFHVVDSTRLAGGAVIGEGDLQEGGGVEHANNLADGGECGIVDAEDGVEGMDELGADVLAGEVGQVAVWPEQDLAGVRGDRQRGSGWQLTSWWALDQQVSLVNDMRRSGPSAGADWSVEGCAMVIARLMMMEREEIKEGLVRSRQGAVTRRRHQQNPRQQNELIN